jgi:hypothetical protein
LEEAVRGFGDKSCSAAEAASREKREAEEVVFLGNPRKLFILNGRPVRTRTADLYRVKAQPTHTYNNLEHVEWRESTPKYAKDEVSTVRRAVRNSLPFQATSHNSLVGVAPSE